RGQVGCRLQFSSTQLLAVWRALESGFLWSTGQMRKLNLRVFAEIQRPTPATRAGAGLGLTKGNAQGGHSPYHWVRQLRSVYSAALRRRASPLRARSRRQLPSRSSSAPQRRFGRTEIPNVLSVSHS